MPLKLGQRIIKGDYVYHKLTGCCYQVECIVDGKFHLDLVDRFGEKLNIYNTIAEYEEIIRFEIE